jgi:ABC-type transporter Mla MlaB component
MNIVRQDSILRVADILHLDAANSGVFAPLLAPLLSPDLELVEFNLQNTRSIDCAGLGALLSFRRLARNINPAVDIRLVRPGSAARRLLSLLGAEQLLNSSELWGQHPMACAA